MKKTWFLSVLVLLTALVNELSAQVEYLDDDQELFDFEASKESDFADPPPPVFILNELTTFNPQLPNVNIITGEYCEEECDLIVGGIEPLSYRRFYGNQEYKDKAYGHWRINPECQIFFNFENFKTNKEKFHKFAGIGDESGGFFLYEKDLGNQCVLDPAKIKSFTNSAHLSGQKHPLNTKVSFQRNKNKRDYYFSYTGVVEDGNGRKRFFATEKANWPTKESYGVLWKLPPHQAFVTEERRPNGNIIQYQYIDYNEDGGRSKYFILKSISVYNSNKTTLLGSLDIHYRRSKNSRNVEQILVTGSDGRQAVLNHRVREVQSKKKIRKWGKTTERPKIVDIVLDHVITSWKPTQYYQYRWEHAKTYFNAPYLFQASQDGGRVLDTSYDLGSKRVIAQSAPVGPNDQMAPIARYEYQGDHTVVYDGENNKTIYRFNSDKRITAIEKYQDNKLYCVEKSEHDPNTGNVLKKTVEDGSGQIFSLVEYVYDKNQNLTEERIGGGQDVITRTYTTDGFNLKETESDHPGRLIEYTYIPGTNLLASEIVLDNGRICKRTFHFYDDQISSVRVKTIIDDGQSRNPNDIAHVTYRRIIEISPKRTVPCVGLPEQIQEKTIDEYGNVLLLKKICYSYHPSGKILREDHYDAHDEHRYSIINTYDDKERLIATTDPLGNETSFTYDKNFNLIAQSGPRADMHKEWIYDPANRPIVEKEWQTDGTILITKKRYDKASRVIASVDACGFETRYEHDALGRITAIHHPDGASERKIYDVLGNVLEETDANGYTTRREYNFRGQQTAIYRPDGSEEHFVYNNNGGTLSCHTDTQGTNTYYFYDIFDRPIQIETYAPNGTLLKVITTSYSAFNKLSETDGEGNTIYYKYDYAGRKVAEEKGGKKTFFFYDSLGRLYKTQEGDALYEEEYDLKGQLIGKKTYDFDGNLAEQERYAYDNLGNRTHVINSKGSSETVYNTRSLPILKKDAIGNTTQFSYEYTNGLKHIEIDPLGIQTIHFHDSRGNEYETLKKNTHGTEIHKVQRRFDGNKNLVQETQVVFEGITPTKTIVHTWIYGPCNRLERFIEAGQKETCYVYDGTGKLSQIIKPDKKSLQSEYDSLSRLAHFFSSDFDYTYAYDKNDRVLSVFDSVTGTKTSRSYGSLDNITSEVLGNRLSLSYSYDIHGRRTQSFFPDGSHVDYVYNTNRLYQIARNGLTYTYVSRDLEGHLSKIELPSNLGVISIERDALSRWKKFASPFYSSVFNTDSYDPVGNLCHYKYSDDLGTKNCSYTYDDLRQLTAEEGHHYVNDSLHNRLVKDDISYSINNLCEITHDGSTAYEYDANGNLLCDGTSRFTYDSLDRLISTQRGADQTVYTYDAFNRRLSKALLTNNKKIKKELYFYDGDNEIGSTDEKGHIQELRLLGEGLGAEIGASVLFEIHGKTYLPIHDHRGCVVTLVNLENKKPAETYRYTAYGEQLTEGELSPWRFSSKRADPETGLIYFGRRYYSPELGRWITPDPQGFDDGPNLYAYLHNCPLTAYDLYGLWTWGGAWDQCCGFWGGVGSSIKEMGSGAYHLSGRMGEWMYADFQYEHFNDSSAFRAKSQQSLGGWRSTGQFAKAAYDNPLMLAKSAGEAFIPGVMDVWRNPTSSEAWGRAAVDIGMIGLAVGKVGQAAKSAGRVGRIAEEGTSIEKILATSGRGAENVNASVKLVKKLEQLESVQQNASRIKTLPDGRIRYYLPERPSNLPGPTRSSSYVTEYDPRTGRVRGWNECYDHCGNVNRVHPKQLNGQQLTSPHYPPTAKDLLQ